jgi:glycosyltransferase involved in cell wall biosynthesis
MKKNKKILFLAPQPFFVVRGTPIATKDMLTILSENYDIDFVSYPQGENMNLKNVRHFRCLSLGVKNVKIGPSVGKIILDITLFFTAFRLFCTKRYDYIHAVEEVAVWGVLFKKLSNAKLIYDMDSIMSEQVSGSKFRILTKLFVSMEKFIIRNSDLILGVSGNFKDYCKEIDPNTNFVEIFDVPQITKVTIPDILKCKFIENERKRVLYIGNGEHYQGLHLLEEVADILIECDFYIIGTGIDKVERNKVYISFVDMSHVWGVMQLCDVLVSPRLTGTNTPMKIYTYMASGKPIVATNIPAHNILKDVISLAGLSANDIATAIKYELASSPDKFLNSAHEVSKKYNLNTLSDLVLNSYYGLK